MKQVKDVSILFHLISFIFEKKYLTNIYESIITVS